LSFDAQAKNKKSKVKYNKHYVKTRLYAPTYTAAPSPGPGYTYIRDDWSWNPNTSTWDWNGNRWVATTPEAKTWVPGHWAKSASGWYWVEGYWK
jgi:hypothetical protein